MSLFGTQGKQEVKQNNQTYIEQDNAELAVEKLEFNKFDGRRIDITYRILNGDNKNKMVKDSFFYNEENGSTWRYQNIRKACGVPYHSNEPEQIDFEELLKGRMLKATLSIRTYQKKDGSGEGQAQGFSYVESEKEFSVDWSKVAGTGAVKQATNIPAIDDDDLPFNSAVVQEQPHQKAEASAPAVTTATTDDDEW